MREADGCLRRRVELELWLGFIRDSIENIPGKSSIIKLITCDRSLLKIGLIRDSTEKIPVIILLRNQTK